ncbi:MAG: histidine kinase [Nibricoccus sp.]
MTSTKRKKASANSSSSARVASASVSERVVKARRSPGLSKNGPETPAWAAKGIFSEARIMAWEGKATPVSATMLYPADAAVFKSLPTASPANWYRCIHPLDRARVQQHFAKITSENLPATIDYRLIDKYGAILWVRHSTHEIQGRGKNALLRGYVMDIQKEKSYQLESLRVSEREQNRIGQDLHDDLCQVLAGVSCLMRVAESRIAAKAPEEAGNFQELNQQIIDAMHRTRALTHGLFPGKIQIADIRGALLELSAQVKVRFAVEIQTQFKGRFPKHSSAQIIQIYRIAQEAMSNAIRHGRATHIAVNLESFADRMELTIRDNGSGLAKSDTSTGGVGLHIMHYRAGILGGELSIANGTPQGVTACLRYPFQN